MGVGTLGAYIANLNQPVGSKLLLNSEVPFVNPGNFSDRSRGSHGSGGIIWIHYGDCRGKAGRDELAVRNLRSRVISVKGDNKVGWIQAQIVKNITFSCVKDASGAAHDGFRTHGPCKACSRRPVRLVETNSAMRRVGIHDGSRQVKVAELFAAGGGVDFVPQA